MLVVLGLMTGAAPLKVKAVAVKVSVLMVPLMVALFVTLSAVPAAVKLLAPLKVLAPEPVWVYPRVALIAVLLTPKKVVVPALSCTSSKFPANELDASFLNVRPPLVAFNTISGLVLFV